MPTISQLSVKVSVDTAEAERNLKGIGGTADSASGHLGGLVKSALGIAGGFALVSAAAAGVNFLKDQLADSVQAASLYQGVIAQTAATLKSTHDASGLTAVAVGQLADSLSRTTPYAREATQEAENMLLTFTGISSKTFPAATRAALDMATALHMNATQAAMQLGKALNDPATGMAMLRREGVTFTQSQMDAAKAMEHSGNLAGAQAIVLKELQKEFGGSAQAAGSTFAGALQIAQNQLEDLKVNIGSALIPILTDLLRGIAPVVEALGDGLAGAAQGVAGFFQHTLMPALQPLLAALPMLWHLAQNLAGVFLSGLKPGLDAVAGAFRDTGQKGSGVRDLVTHLAKAMGDAGPLAKQFGEALGNGIKAILPMLQQVGDFLLNKVLPAVKQLAGFVMSSVVPALITFAGWIGQHLVPVVLDLAGFITTKIVPALEQLFTWFNGKVLPILEAVVTTIQTDVLPAVKQIASDVLTQLVPALEKLWNQVSPILVPALQLVGWLLGHVVGPAISLIINLASGLVTGLADLLGGIGGFVGKVLGFFGGLKDKAIALFVLIEIQIPLKIAGMIGNVLGKMGGFIGSFLGLVGTWKDKALAAVGSLVSGILNFFGSLPGKMVAIGQNIIQGIINGIRSMAGALGGAIKSTVEGIPGIGGLVSHIPGFASGGITPGGIFTGAEQGPELLLKPGLYAAPAGSRVLNAQQTRAALSGNGQGNSQGGGNAPAIGVINIHGSDPNAIMNEFRRQAMLLRMSGRI